MRDKLYNYFYEMIAAGTDENYAYARDLLKVLPKLLPHGEDKKRISDQIDSYIKEQCNMLSSLRNLLNFYQKPEDRKHILNEIDFSSIIKSVNDLQEVLLTFPGITDEMRIKIIDSLDFKKIVSNENHIKKLEKESKKKEYLLKLKEELFEEYEFERRKK